eukprot:SAG11_NODE_7687_length_1109_cov_1.808111_1_plen_68_part_00
MSEKSPHSSEWRGPDPHSSEWWGRTSMREEWPRERLREVGGADMNEKDVDRRIRAVAKATPARLEIS